MLLSGDTVRPSLTTLSSYLLCAKLYFIQGEGRTFGVVRLYWARFARISIMNFIKSLKKLPAKTGPAKTGPARLPPICLLFFLQPCTTK